MKISINDLLFAFSRALDCVEGELLGAATGHGLRVACISAQMGQAAGLDDRQRVCLAAAAVLHDNALTEYIRAEANQGITGDALRDLPDFGAHCTMGEENASQLPFYDDIRGAVLYHHEAADGSGPFGKTAADTPLYARLIHLSDQVDARYNLGVRGGEKLTEAYAWLGANTDSLFDRETVALFCRCITPATVAGMGEHSLADALRQVIPAAAEEYTPDQIRKLAAVFARITDYKSHFTCRHSSGIAEKAQQMGVFYGLSEEMQAKLYLAGALHDVGKLTISNRLLEKPGKLTDDEYKDVQRHVYATYEMLRGVGGMETVTSWAAHHHEKLDGSGYPFGKRAGQLGKYERLMACLDIYQALVEARPYKSGMTHEEAMRILRQMAGKGQLDSGIVEDIHRCFSPGKIA